MSLFDFGKGKKDVFDPLKDLILEKLKVGYYLEYDMKTWQVTAYNKYDFGDGMWSQEWELTSGREKCYLERREDDDVEWALSKKIPLGAIDQNVREHIRDFEDPPGQIEVKGKIFYLDESSSVYYYPGGKEPKQGLIAWEFIDEDDTAFVTLEQWGEEDFEAAQGVYVEEYQFTNILPSGEAQA